MPDIIWYKQDIILSVQDIICMSVCMYVRMHECLHADMYSYERSCFLANTHNHAYIRISTYIYTCIQTDRRMGALAHVQAARTHEWMHVRQ